MQRRTCDYLLIRHLKPDVAAGICYGQTDLAVAETPDAAWQNLMSRCGLPLLSSPLQRARVLADHLSALQKKVSPIREDLRWQELNFGQWEGCSWSEISQQAVQQWQQNLQGFHFPGGESAGQMQQRVISAWCDWQQQQIGGLLVSHLGVIRMLLGAVLQIPFPQQLLLQLDYQHCAWLRQSWLDDEQGHKLPDSELWQLKGLNLSPQALSSTWAG